MEACQRHYDYFRFIAIAVARFWAWRRTKSAAQVAAADIPLKQPCSVCLAGEAKD